MSDRPEITPLAGAVVRSRGRAWRFDVTDQRAGCTIVRSHRMEVPVGNNIHDSYVRLHELGHARFSPLDGPVDHAEAFERIEEVRINQILRDRFGRLRPAEILAGLELREEHLGRLVGSGLSKRRIALNLLEVSDEDTAARATSLFGFEEFEANALAEMIRATKTLAIAEPEAIPSAGEGAANAANRFAWLSMRRFSATFDELFPKDGALALETHAPEPEPPQRRRKRLTDAEMVEYERDMREWELAVRKRRKRPFNVSMFEDLEDDFWGDMVVETPTLSFRTRASRLLQRRPTDMGHRVKRVHRLLTDQMVFQARVRQKGGTLLLDCSGSMTLTVDHVEGLLRLAPAATIAIYAGSGISGTVGWLRIVARNGMRAASKQLELPGYDNLIDGPALRWLATQAKPRYWISDELPTGVAGISRTFLLAECKAICRRAGITSYKTIDAAVKALALS